MASYAIEPIRGARDEPATIIGWQLAPLREGEQVEQREFMGKEDAYTQALDAGGAWLRLHGGNDIDVFTARAIQSSRRMAWDHGYHHAISQRGL